MNKKSRALLCLLVCSAFVPVMLWVNHGSVPSQSVSASKIIQACKSEHFDPTIWCRSQRSFHDHAAAAERKAIVSRLLHSGESVEAIEVKDLEGISSPAQCLLVHVLAMQEREHTRNADALRYCLRSPDIDVQRHAVEAVGLEELGSYDVEIRSSLKASDPGIRVEAIETAVRLDWPDVKMHLENARRDQYSQVRRAALQGLIHVDTLYAMEVLEEANRKDPDGEIRKWAHEALKFLGTHQEDKATEEEREALKRRASEYHRK